LNTAAAHRTSLPNSFFTASTIAVTLLASETSVEIPMARPPDAFIVSTMGV